MVDQLNTSVRASQPAEVTATLQRLEALLASGQPRTGQVIQVTPQAPATANTAPSTALTLGTTAGQPSPTAPISTAAPATTTAVAATTSTEQAATTPQTAANVSKADVYKIQIRLEGRLFELLTTKPIDPGSTIQISRGSDNRLTIQQLPTPAQQPSQQAAQLAQPTAEQPRAAESARLAELIKPRQAGPTVQSTATATRSEAIASPSTPTTAANQARGSSLLPSTTQAAPQNPANPTANVSPAPSHPAPAPSNATVERVATQQIKTELPIRIGTGERVNAEVVSSRPSPAPANAQQAAAAAAQNSAKTALPSTAPVTTAATSTAAANSTAIKTDISNHQIRLNLPQGQKIELVSPRPLPPGTQVQLVRDNQGQLWAELPTAKTQAMEQALREHLPQQQPPGPLLNLLSSAQKSGQLQQAKPLLLSLFQVLLGRSLTSPLQTDAASVKQQVQNSGTLLESKLAQGNTQHLGQDHKAILLKVAQHLGNPAGQRELPTTLSERINELTQQALSRVLVNQITSAGAQAQDAGNEQNRTLALDIPILWQDKNENLQLKIQRDASGSDEETGETLYRWQVRLNFEIDQERRLQADLTLEADRVSIIWSGDPILRQRVESQLDQLQQRLESIGLEIKTLGVREQPADSATTPKPPRSQLIDIQT
ncbi:MAG: flagellar hook-length control protein FliK [Halopseudomonas sp.]